MKTEISSNQDGKSDRIHIIISVVILLIAAVAGALAWLSIANEKLYSPFGILATDDTDPNFYIGISIYITIGVTLLTSALIRFALKLSK